MQASKNDEIYFHHKGVPKSGKVTSAGKHGCTVECEGQQHKIKWGQLAGHKKRAPQRYTVVEEGEDGIIVQDAEGKRRLVRIPPESRADRLELEKKSKPTP